MARRISSPVLIGRDDELRSFDLAMEEAADRRPSLCVIGGEAGVGKSRLVSEFAARTRAAGGVAAVGAATPPAGSVRIPLAAVVQALRTLVRSIDVRLLDHVLGSARGDLAALLPELGPPSASPASPPFAAARLAEAVLIAIEAVAAKRPPLLFALEDLHWLDDATRATVLYVCHNLVDAPVIIVLTYRSDHPREADGFLDVLAELGRSRNVERLELAPLDADAVNDQVRAILGDDAPEPAVREIVRRSGGIPLFVEELVLEGTQGRSEGLPASIRTALEARVERLGAPARSLIESLAVSGGPTRLDVLAEAAAVPWADLPAALDAAAGTYLVTSWPTPQEPGPGRADIRHVLLREGIERSLSDARRVELHRRLGVALERHPEAGGTNELERASTLAKHWRIAGEDAKAVPALLREATEAERGHAFGAAAEAYRSALELWGRIDTSTRTATKDMARPDRAAILERAAHAASLSGRSEEAIALVQHALHSEPSGDAAVDPERTPRLTLYLGRFHAEAGQVAAARAALESVVASRDAGASLRARALTSLSRLLVSIGRAPEAVERAAQAVALADGPRARSELAQAQSARAAALASSGRMEESLEALRAAATAAGHSGRSSSVARPSRIPTALHGYLDRAGVLERAGDLAGAAQVAEAGMRAAASHGLGATHGALFAATAARDLLRAGDWDGADRLIGQVDGGMPAPEIRLVQARLSGLRGRWERAEADVAQVTVGRAPLQERGWAAYPALIVAEMACWRRRFLEARDAISAGVETAVAEGERDTLLDLALLGIRVEADAVLAGARQRRAVGSATRELAMEHWIRVRTEAAGQTASASAREPAILESAAAEMTRFRVVSQVGPDGPDATWQEAASAWERARRAWDDAQHAYEGAYCRWRLAESLVMARLDREAARDALRDAVTQAGRLSAEPLAREIEALARRARLIDLVSPRGATGSDPTAARSRARALGLSEREAEVLALIAEGLTDREIGERLFITTKTTGHHVSHILAKLALDRRGEAAALAFRLGLVEPPG